MLVVRECRSSIAKAASRHVSLALTALSVGASRRGHTPQAAALDHLEDLSTKRSRSTVIVRRPSSLIVKFRLRVHQFIKDYWSANQSPRIKRNFSQGAIS